MVFYPFLGVFPHCALTIGPILKIFFLNQLDFSSPSQSFKRIRSITYNKGGGISQTAKKLSRLMNKLYDTSLENFSKMKTDIYLSIILRTDPFEGLRRAWKIQKNKKKNFEIGPILSARRRKNLFFEKINLTELKYLGYYGRYLNVVFFVWKGFTNTILCNNKIIFTSNRNRAIMPQSWKIGSEKMKIPIISRQMKS